MKMGSVFSLVSVIALFSLQADVAAVRAQGNGAEVFVAELTPLNGSGVSGRATLVKKGDLLLVNMVVKGYEAGRVHPQHIHGKVVNGVPAGDAVCPPPSADTNGDGLISVQEGLPFYGPVRIPLLPFAQPIRQNGAVSYQQTFDLSAFAPLAALDQHVIVLHGLSRTGDPQIDNPLPVACGEIKPARNHRR